MPEICPVCSNELTPGVPVCPHCGFKMIDATQQFAPVTLSDESFASEAKPAAAAALHVVRGPQTGIVIRLGDAAQTIGRSPQCEVFLNDMTVSREHAVIEPCDGGYNIRDTNSFNGVWVNNDSVDVTRRLTSGDVIQIGAFCLLYQEE